MERKPEFEPIKHIEGYDGGMENLLNMWEAWEMILRGYVIEGYSKDKYHVRLNYHSKLLDVVSCDRYSVVTTKRQRLTRSRYYSQLSASEIAERCPYLKRVIAYEKNEERKLKKDGQ